MKLSKEQRLDIGKEIYTGVLTVAEAADKYGLGYYSARECYRQYRSTYRLPSPFPPGRPRKFRPSIDSKSKSYSELKELSNEALIEEVIKARVEAERAKKGYEVKGDGRTRKYNILNRENLK